MDERASATSSAGGTARDSPARSAGQLAFVGRSPGGTTRLYWWV